MSALRPQVYRFATAAQWQSCVMHRFDANKDGSLAPTVRLGLRAVQVCDPGPLSAVAVGPDGAPFWRVSALTAQPAPPSLERQNEHGATVGPFEIDATLADSPRWIVDRDWLWAFDPGSTQSSSRTHARVRRYDRETLQLDLTIDATDVAGGSDDPAHLTGMSIVDIASDGREGVWLLLRSGGGLESLVHFDCEGRLRGRLRIPCEVGRLREIGTVKRGKSLVLLQEDGAWLWLMDTVDATVQRAVRLENLAPRWSATQLATDARNRIALGCVQAGNHWSLCLLDGSGDVLDGPLVDLVVEDQRVATSAPPAAPIIPGNLAVRGDTLWFATPRGLWRLDSSGACRARESESSLLTPALVSPRIGAERGWLRAEVTIDLPRGAVLKAEYASTDDERQAYRLIDAASDASTTAESKQRDIWSALEPPPLQLAAITGPTTPGSTIAIPLFESQDRWLWLRLTIVTPPGTVPPILREIRVLYPDLSLTRHLPAVFRGSKNDSTGLLRRLAGVLESTTQRIDEKIRGIGTNIDPETAPDDWLDYLGRWLDLPWDDALPVPAKRCLLQHAGELLALRGTRKGLEQLLRCLLVADGVVSIVDLTVDHPPLRLGGGGCVGGPLPALLAGASPRAATLGGKAVLGRAHLSCRSTECDPLQHFRPALRISLTASRTTYNTLRPLLADVLLQYVPAGITVSITWQVRSDFLFAAGGGTLDADGPAALGDDSVIGRTVLAGRSAGRIGEAGIEMGVRLK